MAIVNDHVRLLSIITRDPDAAETFSIDLGPANRARHDSMPQHAESKEWERHMFGEEDAANVRRQTCEREANTAYDDILEYRGALHEWRLAFLGREVSLIQELEGKCDD